jgi:hypothetical protein
MSKAALMAAALALVVAGVPAAPVSAQNWSARAAENQCRDQLRSRYNVSGTRNVTSSDRGNGRFQVNGNADRSGQTAYFNCRVEYGNVRNLNVGRWEERRGGGGGDAVAAVGIAVALGAIIAAASSKKKSHEHDPYPDGYQDNSYGSDSYSPSGGITCYRQQRACFDSYNNYNAGWTSREFGY